MENTPQNADNTSENSDKKDSKKKKKAGQIGSFLVIPEAKPKESEKEKKSVYEQVFGLEKKTEKVDDAEQKEAEDSTSELTPDEKQFIEREYVQAYEHGDIEPTDTPEEVAAEAAVEEFHDLIQEGMDSEDALAATMEKLEAEADDIKEAREEKQNTLTKHVSKLSEFIMPVREDISEQERFDASQATKPANPIKFDFLSHPKEPSKNVRSKESTKSNQENVQTVANPAGAALLGGIVGYLVGRRRGKVAGEAKMHGVQKKLQKEVVNLGWQLSVKEETIRRTARRNAYLASQFENSRSKKEAPLAVVEVLSRAVTTPEKVIYSRESKVAPKAEAPKITKHVENLKRGELLEISRKIIVDGTSLRQIYESHLISERGLRRLVKEHLKGGNLKKALKRELMQREIDFERDPNMRDQDIHRVEQTESKGLEDLIQKATVNIPFDSGSSISFDNKPVAKVDVQPAPTNLRTLDVVLSSVIAILAAAVIMLLLNNY